MEIAFASSNAPVNVFQVSYVYLVFFFGRIRLIIRTSQHVLYNWGLFTHNMHSYYVYSVILPALFQ